MLLHRLVQLGTHQFSKGQWGKDFDAIAPGEEMVREFTQAPGSEADSKRAIRFLIKDLIRVKNKTSSFFRSMWRKA